MGRRPLPDSEKRERLGITLPANLIKRAKAVIPNISGFVEPLLEKEVKKREQKTNGEIEK